MRDVIVTTQLVEELVAIHNIKNFFTAELVDWQTSCIGDTNYKCYIIDSLGCRYEWDGHTENGTSELDALQKAKAWFIAEIKGAE